MEVGVRLTVGLADWGLHESILDVACAKTFATEGPWSIANDALQVAGGFGYTREYAFERIVRDARVNTIFEGTNQVLRMMVGAEGLRSLMQGRAAAPESAS